MRRRGAEFSYVEPLQNTTALPLCHRLGDITIRVKPSNVSTSTYWSTFSSSAGALSSSATHGVRDSDNIKDVNGYRVLMAHDITDLLNATDAQLDVLPLQV